MPEVLPCPLKAITLTFPLPPYPLTNQVDRQRVKYLKPNVNRHLWLHHSCPKIQSLQIAKALTPAEVVPKTSRIGWFTSRDVFC